MKHFRHRRAAAIVLAVAPLLAGCGTPAPEEPPAEAPPFRPIATIREVMNSVIDPSVDIVWNSVASVVDDSGLTDHAPATDDDWAEVRRHALVVSEAANLLLMRNRPVAHPGERSNAPGVELPPEEVRTLIDENPDAWNSYAEALRDSLTQALAAIEAKDPQALVDAGEQIDLTCENCHQVFWFPNTVASAR